MSNSPLNKSKAQTVAKLQKACASSFTAVMASLREGLSETDIADALQAHVAKNRITEQWYDVPFLVLIGEDRFREGTTTTDYSIKSPSPNVFLERGMVVHVDFSPMDSETAIWGDWSSTCIFHPGEGEKEKLAFLKTMRDVHREGIPTITMNTTGAEVTQHYLNKYKDLGVTLLDVRGNVGHSLHNGPKAQANRTWLDLDNKKPLGTGTFAIEPGGMRESDGAVARFEEAVLITESGASIIDSGPEAPLSV